MKKQKVFIIAVFLSVAAAAQTHSLGLGAQFNYSSGDFTASGMSLLISPSRTTNLALNWFFGDSTVIGLTLDVVPLQLPVSTFPAGSFNFTLGAGLFTSMMFYDDFGFNFGVRVPIGFNLLLANNMFEVFTHIAPSFGLRLLPSFDFASPFFPFALGARIWLR